MARETRRWTLVQTPVPKGGARLYAPLLRRISIPVPVTISLANRVVGSGIHTMLEIIDNRSYLRKKAYEFFGSTGAYQITGREDTRTSGRSSSREIIDTCVRDSSQSRAVGRSNIIPFEGSLSSCKPNHLPGAGGPIKHHPFRGIPVFVQTKPPSLFSLRITYVESLSVG